jgi:hypothetical protein
LKADFSGEWAFNEDESIFDSRGSGSLPSLMQITQYENNLIVQKTIVQEYTDDRITIDSLTLDGKENKSLQFNSILKSTANWSPNFDTLFVSSNASLKFGNRTVEMNTDEKWFLKDHGKILSIIQSSNSFWGKRNLILVYNKR